MHFIYGRIKRNFPKLIRFGVVGTIGAAINFSIYYAASELAHFEVNLSAIAAFGVAVVNNYILNHLWTFKTETENGTINFKQLTYYIAVNIQGLVINLVALNLVVFLAGMEFHLSGQMLGIFLGMLSNFILAKKFVFAPCNTDLSTHPRKA